MTSREVIKILKKHGFEKKSQHGSHLKLINGQRTAIVPIHGAKDVPIGTIKSIEKQSGVSLR